MKYISILGSTGSIGTQTLEVVSSNMDKLKVCAISGNENIDLLHKQIHIFKPNICAVMNKEKAIELKKRLGNGETTEIVSGIEGLITVSTYEKSDIIVTAVSGMIGLRPTIEALRLGKTVALANKETLVAGGSYVMETARKYNSKILPVDSEHSAIFQSLMGNSYKDISKIILTASGGPFRGKKINELEHVSVSDALNHPNWSMGKKITIDSATLMNKGLEVIEAKWLFNVEPSQIEVVVHPQSILHSAVEYIDHSVIGQFGCPTMKTPIQVALFYPERIENDYKSLSLSEIRKLTFEKPDLKTFKCLKLAYDAIEAGGTMPAVLNASNEVAVDLFLRNKIKFLDIGNINERIMSLHKPQKIDCLDVILEAESWTRKTVLNQIL